MKVQFILTSFFIIILTFLLKDTNIYAQSGFEGKIKMKVVSDGETQFAEYYIKNNKTRIEGHEGEEKGVIISDPDNKKMYMVMTEQKMYMVMPFDASEAIKNDKSEDWEKGLKNVKLTGRTKTIHGYECKEAVFNSENETSVIWFTSELGTFFGLGGAHNKNLSEDLPDEFKKIMGDGFFPMISISKDENGDEIKTEVEEITKMSLSDDLFNVPADFKKFEMPNMQDMMKNRKN